MEVCWKIKGRVQRVGYRRWAINKAAQLGGISGYVYNDISGDVFVLAEGDAEKINKLMTECYKGPLFARVDEIINAPELKNYFPPIKKNEFLKI